MIEFFNECDKEGMRWSSRDSLMDMGLVRSFGLDGRMGFGKKIDSYSDGITYGCEESWDDEMYKQKEITVYCLLTNKELYLIEVPS